ncbi:cation transporter dimerization domain-containing protein [Gorillibacterium timonense]|uniref:cation transporter dimerization domain-containing protein n=1 Tax=Gorillibacterium timonense TaxID=1689269 RepID=UPI00071D1EA1|nr:cation transporter dimerization domain-containing protein [Gorillibacterium timonense]
MALQRNHLRNRTTRSTAVRTVALAGCKAAAGIVAGSTSLVIDGLSSLSQGLGPVARLVFRKKELTRSDSQLVQKAYPIPHLIAISFYLFLGFEGAALSLKELLSDAPEGRPFPYPIVGLAAAVLFAGLHVAARLRGRDKAGEFRKMMRSGAIPSLLALVGSLNVALSGLWGMGVAHRLDAAAGLAIGALMIRNGWKLAVGQAPSQSHPGRGHRDVEELIKAAQEVRGIIMVDALEACEQGHYVAVTVTVSVNPHISVAEGQEIARSLSSHLLHEFLHLSDVLVIVHPYDRGYPYNNGIGSEHPVFPPMVH